jgi:hypothetical protein
MRSPLARTAGPKVELILRAAEDLWPVSIDADQIEFALVQVASNAHDAMPEGGHLKVETSNARVAAATADLAAGDYVALSLEDTVEGCSEAALERAFEPFFSTRTDPAHLGLGLSVVLGIAKQHGGTARVLPASGGGCRVEIYLPRAREAEISASRSQEAAPQARQLAKSTVLVVDDDPDLRAVARDGLEILGCDVLLADGGPEALDILKSHGQVDLLMVDVRMGGMNGLELIQRARGIWPDLKALVMTGGAEVPDLRDAAIGMLRKPFRVDDLAQEIAALLSRGEPASQ